MNRLAITRVLLGALFLFRTSALSHIARGIHAPVIGPLLGWPDHAPVHAVVGGLVLPSSIAAMLAIVRTLSALSFTIGYRVRASGVVAAGCGWIALAQDPFGFTFTLHVMLLAVAVHAFATKPSASSYTLARIFTASIYFWSAIPKLNVAWLSGDVLRAYHALGMGHSAFFLDAHASATAIATVVMELSLPALLLCRRTRTIAVIIACMMHTIVELFYHPDVFGWLMVVLLVPFWPSNEKLSPSASR